MKSGIEIEGQRCVSSADAAAAFDVTTPTIRNWINQGKLKGFLNETTGRWWVTVDSIATLAKEKYGDD